jgi:hypothetical protein
MKASSLPCCTPSVQCHIFCMICLLVKVKTGECVWEGGRGGLEGWARVECLSPCSIAANAPTVSTSLPAVTGSSSVTLRS